jgi:hypothetical protein
MGNLKMRRTEMKPKLPANFPPSTTLLNLNDPHFAKQLANVLGVEKGESVEIITSQFTRTDGKKITYMPTTVEEFDRLKTMSENNLKIAGCQIWDKENGNTHWLYPAEWYNFIPDGYIVTGISGEAKPFRRGATDDDVRYGVLAYGFVQKEN